MKWGSRDIAIINFLDDDEEKEWIETSSVRSFLLDLLMLCPQEDLCHCVKEKCF